MAYQVLARKWRPQDFSEVLGQESIVTALRNALTDGRIAQAYLFSGIRGVGKTSVARILAKALNCERGPTPDPCNECVACKEITASSGSNLDVHEIDAATHSKVEQVRELTEGLKYGPARDRYKVVIIDEIHRLSRQAFDALLKIVEEPPPHLVFIFATTESTAVPVTILSRCQEFRFRRVPSPALAGYLKTISDAEEIEVGDAALRLLARAGDGSVRDAVALLDQLATFGSGRISDEEAARLLGGVDHALFQRLLAAIVAGEARSVSAIIREIESQGWDPRHVYGEFLNYCRDALHLALGGQAGEVDLPAEEAARLSSLAASAGYENLLRLLQQLLASENSVRRSEMGSLALEICWLRAAELPKLVRIEELLGGRTPESDGGASPGRGREPQAAPTTGAAPESGRLFRTPAASRAATGARGPEPPAPPDPPSGPAAGPPVEPDSRPGPAVPAEAEAEPAQASPVEPAGEPATVAAGVAHPESADPSAPGNGRIGKFLDEVSRRKLPLAAHLREAPRIEFQDRTLRIHCLPQDAWLNPETLGRASNRKALEGAIAATFGERATWKVVERDAPRAGPERGGAPEVKSAAQDPRVQKVLDIFGGRVESVDDP